MHFCRRILDFGIYYTRIFHLKMLRIFNIRERQAVKISLNFIRKGVDYTFPKACRGNL